LETNSHTVRPKVSEMTVHTFCSRSRARVLRDGGDGLLTIPHRGAIDADDLRT
jgi:hypothetical protein